MKTSIFSVVIICYNEERTIKKAINSALKITNDVIVVDSYSSDKTPQICKQYKVKFYQNEWKGFGDQRNFGAEKCSSNFIISLDADEEFSPKLIEELLEFIPDRKQWVGSFKRKNFYKSKSVNFGSWGRDAVLRAYNKEYTRWDNRLVHETIATKNTIIKNFNGLLLHHPIATINDLYKKAEKYSSLSAQQIFIEKKRPIFFQQFINPLFKFVKEYFFQLGFLDGKFGFQIAKINAYETYLKYMKLHLLYRTKS